MKDYERPRMAFTRNDIEDYRLPIIAIIKHYEAAQRDLLVRLEAYSSGALPFDRDDLVEIVRDRDRIKNQIAYAWGGLNCLNNISDDELAGLVSEDAAADSETQK